MVHGHGIGKYLGIETLVINDQKRDYLNIKYGGTDRLYIPTDQVDVISPTSGWTKKSPNSPGWAVRVAKGQDQGPSIGSKRPCDLVELYAAREAAKRLPILTGHSWQQQFEEMFPYEETPDQERAIKEIKRDMEARR